MSEKDNNYKNGRREFIKNIGLVGAGIAASTASVNALAQTQAEQEKKIKTDNEVPFYGEHQAGIETPAQRNIYFLVADLHSNDPKEIKEMFQMWTTYSRRLSKGMNIKPYSDNEFVPPTDTGEADSLNAHNLTLTFGVSPSFFTKLGIEKLRPEELKDLPHFPRDQIKKHYSGGDICIQACADDPQVAFHAVRNLVRSARGKITMKWSQAGFNSTDNPKQTVRNLFAFKDGTANEQGSKLPHNLWTQESDWLNGGTYLIARRIKMFLETWDRTSAKEQNNTFGRDRNTGAAMGQKREFDAVDLTKKDEKGNAVVPENSHVHLANKTGKKLLRRSFSYSSGIDDKGQFDAGLLFISFQASPEQFITIQNAFGSMDKMSEYTMHQGSGIFACFPGVKDENDYLGKALFEQI